MKFSGHAMLTSAYAVAVHKKAEQVRLTKLFRAP